MTARRDANLNSDRDRHFKQRVERQAARLHKAEQVTLEELAKLPAARLEAIRADTRHVDDLIQISTAYPLDETQCQALQQAVDRLLARAVRYEFRQDPSLIAGLRIGLGPWIVQANLREELQLFREVAYVNPPLAH